jgi:hypothetical protein
MIFRVRIITDFRFIVMAIWQTQLVYHLPPLIRVGWPLNLVIRIPLWIAHMYILIWAMEFHKSHKEDDSLLDGNPYKEQFKWIGWVTQLIVMHAGWYYFWSHGWYNMPNWYWIDLYLYYWYVTYVFHIWKKEK